ncbi:MAG: HU family DNA-binding protein [Candidatus Phytoplasma pruni]|uniref:HU family DNA-binding protein n=1 Tax=Milkweed yellows phytoplasma TaxID=208434 RepID=UPI00036317B5|nr:HU family DNA-binding protein [Milkweed yellows phytoplasma]
MNKKKVIKKTTTNKKNTKKQDTAQKDPNKIAKKELISEIAKEGKVSFTEANAFYSLFEEVLFQTIANNKEVVLGTRLGKFVVSEIKACKRPEMKAIKLKNGQMKFKKTGKMIKYPASLKVSFKIAKPLKEAVKQ